MATGAARSVYHYEYQYLVLARDTPTARLLNYLQAGQGPGPSAGQGHDRQGRAHACARALFLAGWAQHEPAPRTAGGRRVTAGAICASRGRREGCWQPRRAVAPTLTRGGRLRDGRALVAGRPGRVWADRRGRVRTDWPLTPSGGQ